MALAPAGGETGTAEVTGGGTNLDDGACGGADISGAGGMGVDSLGGLDAVTVTVIGVGDEVEQGQLEAVAAHLKRHDVTAAVNPIPASAGSTVD